MLSDDIERKAIKLYGAQYGLAKNILLGLTDPQDPTQRVIRCVLVLGGGSLDKLKEVAAFAKDDFRDVIMGAEYDKAGNRIANYNNPFPDEE
jgi:hypothetical protein